MKALNISIYISLHYIIIMYNNPNTLLSIPDNPIYRTLIGDSIKYEQLKMHNLGIRNI